MANLKRSAVLDPLPQPASPPPHPLPSGLDMKLGRKGSLCSRVVFSSWEAGIQDSEMWGCRGNLSSLDVSLPCQATMAELQEVQITEEKPLLPGQTPEVAKVIRDPLTPRPEFQTSKPPHLLPFQIQNLILTHIPTFSTSTDVSVPINHNLESRPLSCYYTNLHPLHVSFCYLFLFLVSVISLPISLYLCLSLHL